MTERLESVLAGDRRAGSKLMRALDDRDPRAITELKELYAHTGRAYIVGVTGNPGVGKSTVVDGLIASYRADDLKVGVVAVDPSSPFSGGAILGDRIRMQQHALDPGVFIRSLATRGQLGGLSRSTFDVTCVLDAMGFDRILVETVGVGQDEIDVMKSAYTSVVITVPGLGDDIQALKAGILEIADVLVVNKADRDGVDRTVRDLVHMLDLRAPGARKEVEIVQTVAAWGLREGSGVSELKVAIEGHRERSFGGEVGVARMRERALAHLGEVVRALLKDRAEEALVAFGGLGALADEVAARRRDPYSAAESILAAI